MPFIGPTMGAQKKRENGATRLERSKRKKNRGVVTFVRIERMALFTSFCYLVLVTPLSGPLKKSVARVCFFCAPLASLLLYQVLATEARAFPARLDTADRRSIPT